MKKDDVCFGQSLSDFPMVVSLEKKAPVFGLSRWAGNESLRFMPPDDEGFTLRGDKQRLLYKGRRRSHRFTILGDTAFEYDCILNKEPESNVISLLMEGAENYDFFRQPDFVPDPFLKGSYAVYKKETLLGEGTGKLCHIHRPLIIDALGRRVWGDLSLVGNCLCITIPEQWLAEAKYPVVVDPTIGTTTVGSQNKWQPDPPEPAEPLFFEIAVPVNRFLVSEAINGLCTGYFYVNQDDGDGGGRAVLYSDNGNSPLARRSSQEKFIELRIRSGQSAGWRSGTFNGNGVNAGQYVWFGVFSEYFWFPRFDWGARCYSHFWDAYDSIPNNYPIYNVNSFSDFKLSMYFTYTSAQNYTRTLTQGVTLSDSLKLTGNYKRSTVETVKGAAVLSAPVLFLRQCLMNVSNSIVLSRVPTFIRSASNNVGIADHKTNRRGISRICDETVYANSDINRSQGFNRGLVDSLYGNDTVSAPVLFIRSVSETQSITDKFIMLKSFIRGLYDEAGNIAETIRHGEFYRVESDTVQVEGSVLRGLLIFVKIFTTSLVRDFILRRFLIAREELVLKSCITRELTLESKIN